MWHTLVGFVQGVCHDMFSPKLDFQLHMQKLLDKLDANFIKVEFEEIFDYHCATLTDEILNKTVSGVAKTKGEALIRAVSKLDKAVKDSL